MPRPLRTLSILCLAFSAAGVMPAAEPSAGPPPPPPPVNAPQPPEPGTVQPSRPVEIDPNSVRGRIGGSVRALPSWNARTQLDEFLAKAGEMDRLEAVGELRTNPESRPLLLALATDRSDSVAREALLALAAFGPGPRADHDAIAALFTHHVITVRRAALDVLAAWKDRRDVPAIAGLITPESKLASVAIGVLHSLTGERFSTADEWREWYRATEEAETPAWEALRADLGSTDPAKVQAAIAAVRTFPGRSAEAAELLKPLMRDDDDRVASAAADAIRISGVSSVIPDDVPVVAAPAPVAKAAAVVIPPAQGNPWPIVIFAVLALGVGWWLVRRLTAGTAAVPVSQVLAEAARVADGGEARPAPRASGRPGVKPVAGKPGQAKPPGKPGERIFKLD